MENKKLREFVESSLMDGQSPQAIAGRLKYVEKDILHISKDTIYDFLDSPLGRIIVEKRKKRKMRKKRKKVKQLTDRVFLDKRPKIIEKRKRVGDCEGDFIVSGRSGKGILLVVIERKSRVVFIEQILDISIDEVHVSFIKIQKRFPEMKSLTLDNDILFAMHKTLKILLGIPLYFCHPYHSWEKGSVENVNKYIRRFIPKGDDISLYDTEYISLIEKKCNERFMKCLEFETPQEVMEKWRKKQKNTDSGVE